MPLIVIEGPEKAGKTTLAHNITMYAEHKGYKVVNVHNTSSYVETLDADLKLVACEPETIFIFDRWYLSELVYSHDRSSTLPGVFLNPTLAHTRWGKSINTRILLLDDIEELRKRRTSEDADIDPEKEVELYSKMALNQWSILYTREHTPQWYAKWVLWKALQQQGKRITISDSHYQYLVTETNLSVPQPHLFTRTPYGLQCYCGVYYSYDTVENTLRIADSTRENMRQALLDPGYKRTRVFGFYEVDALWAPRKDGK